MTVAVDPRIGTELAGYRVEALLGRGGMSDVYLAHDLRLKRRVALKLLAPDLARDERFRERFLRESELAASLDHANVIPVFEAGEVDGVLYIAMRYVEGSDLKSVLAAEGLLEPARALALLDQVAAALDAAHERGLVHRDVKPGNILVATQGGREHVYLSDFGLTKHTAEEAGLTESGQFFGTAEYVAPEQIEGGQIDGRADVYSLGCVLYECLSGRVPFGDSGKVGLLFAHLQEPPPSLTQKRPELPAGIDAVIAKAMAKEPDQRYPSCGELAETARATLAPAISARLPAPLDGPAPPLVGRDKELVWLRGAWTRACEGDGSLLMVSGPRGIGKTRLAAELAREASADGGAVRYASCLGSDDGAGATLSGTGSIVRPTLLVLEDLDAAEATVLEGLDSLAGEADDRPLLVVGTCRHAGGSPALGRLVARLGPDRARELAPLDAEEARQIVALHAGAAADIFPVEKALEATDGVPLRLHVVAGEWARAEASRRLGSAAAQAAADRSSLRKAEAAVADNVVELQLAGERARLYFPEFAEPGGGEPSGPCPFKGLASFEAADADYFFGRERLVAELVARLVGAGFLGIVGPSGSGKSSVLRAGLLPALAAGVLPGSERWRCVLLRPGEHPVEELARALDSDDAAPVAAAIRSLAAGERLLLAVDQFEELFTACRSEEERTTFADTMVAAAADPEQRAAVVVAARADFYGRCAAYPALAELLGANHVLVGPMQAQELRRAIELPAARAGLQVGPELVEALVADVEDEPGALPLLSTSLLELWQKRDGNTLTLATYRDSGGVHGAVARLAEGAYERLAQPDRPVARGILLRLAGEGEGDAVVRRRAPLAEFDIERNEATARVLAALTERRLVTVSEGTVEVAHEALLREWPRLREWIQEDSQGRSLRRHITESATEWDTAGRDQDALYRGARLAAALDWTADHEHELNQLERDFVTESREASEQETKRVRRTNRRLRGLLIGVAILLAAAIAGGIFAVVQRGQARDAADKAEASAEQAQDSATQAREAEDQARDAAAQAKDAETAQLAQRLGAQALAEDDLDRSLLLARQAVAIDNSPQTRAYLLAALQRSPAAVGIVRAGVDSYWIALSPDGRLLAVENFRGEVLLSDARSLRQLGDPLWLANAPGGLAFSPDGRTLAAAGDNGNGGGFLELWDVSTRAIRVNLHFPFPFGEAPSRYHTDSVAYLPDGRLLVTAQPQARSDGSPGNWLLVFRDPSSGEPTGRPIVTGAGPIAFAFTPDGRSVLTSNRGPRGALTQWDIETRRRMRIFEGQPGTLIVSLTVRPDGETVAIGRTDGSIGLVDLHSGQERTVSGRHSAALNTDVFSPDGKTLATTSEDGTAVLWDAASGALREILRGHTASVEGAAFSPDGNTLYTVSQDATAIAWDLSRDRRLSRPFASGPPLGAGQFSSDGKLIAVALDKDGIGLWDAATLRRVGLLAPTGGPVAGLDFTPNGNTLAAVNWDGKATVWDVDLRSLLRGPWDVTRGFVQSQLGSEIPPVVRISPDGTTLAVAGRDGATLWSIATGASLGRYQPGGAVDIAFDPTGERIALATGDGVRWVAGTAEIWDVARRTRIWVVVPDSFGNYTIALSPDGKVLATAGREPVIRLWDARTGKLIRELQQGDQGALARLEFSPDGTILVASGYTGIVTLWDVATGTRVGKLEDRVVGSSAIAWYTGADLSPDGKRLLMTLQDGRGLVWDVDPEAWKQRACAIANRTLTQEEWEEFLPDLPYEPACASG